MCIALYSLRIDWIYDISVKFKTMLMPPPWIAIISSESGQVHVCNDSFNSHDIRDETFVRVIIPKKGQK